MNREEGGMITDTEIIEALREHCLVYSHRQLPRGHIRFDTKLLYPDGASIGVFVECADLLKHERRIMSDFGMSFAKLAEFQVNPRHPKSRFQAIEESVRDLGVRVSGDRLVLELTQASALREDIIKLGQACLRVSYIIYSRRSTQRVSLSEEIRVVIENTGLDYVPKHRFKGPFERDVEVDYRVTGPTRHTSILALGGSHTQANEVFRKWSDLDYSKVEDQFVTIFDERKEVERKEDLVRLERVSEVLSLTNRKGIEMVLKAA
jgi:hypothetical protein